jgi:hypothetical protein
LSSGTRLGKRTGAYPIINLFYGFFLTQVVAANEMDLMMFPKNDPTFLRRDFVVFLFLAAIIVFR